MTPVFYYPTFPFKNWISSFQTHLLPVFPEPRIPPVVLHVQTREVLLEGRDVSGSGPQHLSNEKI